MFMNFEDTFHVFAIYEECHVHRCPYREIVGGLVTIRRCADGEMKGDSH